MQAERCSQNQIVGQLKQLVESQNFSKSRDEFIKLFTAAVIQFPNSACSLFMRGIERLIKEKMSPEPEICHLFAFLVSSENPIALKDILTTTLPSKYVKLQYYLRLYTLRTLMLDKDTKVSCQTLLGISGDQDSGKMTVIDFILTRSALTEELARLLLTLAGSLEKSDAINSSTKRGMAIENIRQMFKLDHCNGKMSELSSIITHKLILNHWTQLMKANPQDIRIWLNSLKQQSTTYQDSEVKLISNALTNLGTSFKANEVVIDIWTLAITLEAQLRRPSSNIFNKVWRLILTISFYPDADFKAISLGLQLCIVYLGIQPGTQLLSNEHIVKFSGIASALYQITNWDPIVSHVTDGTLMPQYRDVVIWLLVVLAGMGKAPHKGSIDKLMELSPSFDLEPRIELEHSYCASFGSCYDKQFLEDAIITLEKTHNFDQKNKVLAILAKDCHINDPPKAYHWCQQITSSEHQSVQDILIECGFLDIASNLGINIVRNLNTASDEILTAVSAAKSEGDCIKFIDLLVNSWVTLFSCGCHQDSSKYIRAAYKAAGEAFGAQSVRTQAIRKLLERFLTQTGQYNVEEAEKLNKVSIPACIENAVCMLSSHWTYKFQQLSSFSHHFRELECLLSKDVLWSLLNESALCYPAIITKEKSHAESPLTRNVYKKFLEVCDSIPELVETSWLDKVEFSHRLNRLLLIHSNFASTVGSLPASLQNALQTYSLKLLQNIPIQASRSFHTGRKISGGITTLPKNVVCLLLNFDDKNTLSITRTDSNNNIMIRLPTERNHDFNNALDHDFNFEDNNNYSKLGVDKAIAELDDIIQRSVNVPTDNTQEFWKEQAKLDGEMELLIRKMQKVWFGGFTGLLTLKSLDCDSQTKDNVKSKLASYVEYQRSRPAWDINPIYISLLKFALDNNNTEEVEDIIIAIFDAMNFQGLSVPIDEVNTTQLIRELKTLLVSASEQSKLSKDQHLVLVCDRTAAQIPWEIFPIFKDYPKVTRALSFQQVCDWSHNTSNHKSLTSYLVNPGNDLPQTHKVFVNDFKNRGWTGLSGEKPSEEIFSSLLRTGDNFVYFGHGSGKMYIRGSELRKLYKTPTAIYLLGCSSVRIKNALLDDDALTDYSVMGGSLIMGTLWPVKDKDFNRFNLEFLSRVFDEKLPISESLHNARNACVLPYLTGGAPVIYGLLS